MIRGVVMPFTHGGGEWYHLLPLVASVASVGRVTCMDASDPASADANLGHARPSTGPSIYDVARAAGVAASTVSRALSKPGRVSFATAEHVRQVAEEIGYRSRRMERMAPSTRTSLLAVVVADITNPAFHGMIRGAERTAAHAGCTTLVIETQESEETERAAVHRVLPVVDGVVLTSSRMSDAAIREAAKQRPLVVLNRMVSQVPSIATDNVRAVKKATEHLLDCGAETITYLAGPEASWANGMRWRGLLEAGHELELKVRRIGPFLPTTRGGSAAAEQWLQCPTSGVIAYNDLIAIGFIRSIMKVGRQVPGDVRVLGFDNIPDSALVEPRLSTIAAPLVSLASTAVNHLVKGSRRNRGEAVQPVLLPARLVVRDTTGPARLR